MKIQKILIHNFRSIKHQGFLLDDYSLLVWENNAWKTNIIRALRIFYEDNIKYDPKIDFPKITTNDKESYIDIEYITSNEEQETLKEEYKNKNNILKVRKIFQTDNEKFKDKIKSNQSNIFWYENWILSENYFYWAKNISNSKLWKVIYIPELSKVDDSLKMSWPSPLRDMMNFVVKKVIEKSSSFSILESAFKKFNEDFKKEESNDGFSIDDLSKNINDEIKNWNINFWIDINSIKADDIIKNLISHFIEDWNLNNQRVNIDSFWQWLQRHLIYTLIKLSTKYNDDTESKKKEFSPDFTLILFEEPEAFLHPTQQEKLNNSLIDLSRTNNQQIIITTHSPIFVRKNTENIYSIIKINRNIETIINQIKKDELLELFNSNWSMFKYFLEKLSDPTYDISLKWKIRQKKLANENDDEEIKLTEESFKYFLWIDSERASSFFAKTVIICEWASEKVFFDYLIDTKWQDLKDKHIYILDSLWKFNIHRFMNLFNSLWINHSIIMDSDEDKDIHKEINTFIENNKNSFTKDIYCFTKDLEDFLWLPSANRKDLKPLNIIKRYTNNEIEECKIQDLRKILDSLL